MQIRIRPVLVEMVHANSNWTSFGRNDLSYFTLTRFGRNINIVEIFIACYTLDRQTTDIYFTLSILILETQKQAQMKHKVVECHVSKLTFNML